MGSPTVYKKSSPALHTGANRTAVSSQPLLRWVPCKGPVLATGCPESNAGLLAVGFTF